MASVEPFVRCRVRALALPVVAAIAVAASLHAPAHQAAAQPLEPAHTLYLPTAMRHASLAPKLRFELVDQLGGSCSAVFAVESQVYMGEGPRLIIVDTLNPRRPTAVGRSEVLAGPVTGVAVESGTAYVTLGEAGLQLIDVTNPRHPRTLGLVTTPGTALGVIAAGETAFVAGGDAGLHVVDVSDVDAPLVISTTDTPGTAYDVELSDDYAFVADGDSGLRGYDVSRPDSPIAGGFVEWSWPAIGLHVVDGHAYVAADDGGLRVIDIRSPSAPSEVGHLGKPDNPIGRVLGVHVSDGRAYLANFLSGLHVVDVSTPTAPREVGDAEIWGAVIDVHAIGNIAYAASGSSGLRVVDASDPTRPWVAGRLSAAGAVLSLHRDGSRVYAAGGGGLAVLDATEPGSPRAMSAIANRLFFGFDMTASGDFAYVAAGEFHVVDASDPTGPWLAGSISRPADTWMSVAYDGRHVFLGGLDNFLIVDVSDSRNPRAVGRRAADFVTDLDVDGGHAYVIELLGGMRVFDVSNPRIASAVVPSGAFTDAIAVDVAGGFAYLLNFYNRLVVVDVTNPHQPRPIGQEIRAGDVQGLHVSGDSLFLAECDAIRVIDVRHPTAPFEYGLVQTPACVHDVAIVDDFVYAAAGGDGGVLVYRMIGVQ